MSYANTPTNHIDEREHRQNNMDFMRNLEEKEIEMIRKKNAWQDIVPIMQEKDKKLSKAKIF